MKFKKDKWYWKRKIKRFFRWFYLRIPVTMEKHINMIMEYNRKIKEINRDHKIELEETERRVDEIIKKLSNTTVYKKKNSPHYGISFDFSHMMINGITDLHQRKIMARRVGYIIEKNILSSSFIQLPEV